MSPRRFVTALGPSRSSPRPVSPFSAALGVAVAIALALSGCTSLGRSDPALAGSWLSAETGYLVDIRGSSVRLYDTTPSGLVPFFEGRLDGDRLRLTGPVGLPGIDALLALEGDRLSIIHSGTQRFSFERLGAEARDAIGLAPSCDPAADFEALAAGFSEHYAFFGERGGDWAARVEAIGPRATAATSDGALFALLSELLSPLDDAHINLYGPSGAAFEPARPIPWLDSSQLFVNVIKANYLVGPPSKAAGGKLAYGRLKTGPAYLCLLGMEGYATGGFEAESVALEAALDEALAAVRGAPGLILDLRFNGGGHDAHALAVAARFARERTLAYARAARLGDAWAAEERFYVEPVTGSPVTGRPVTGGLAWDGPLVVLASEATTSAAEVLTLCLKALPGTVIVGEPTRGAFSDMLFKRLPNGWVYTLSYQAYRAADGALYEARGVPPDVVAPMDAAAAAAGRDTCLEAALRALAEASR